MTNNFYFNVIATVIFCLGADLLCAQDDPLFGEDPFGLVTDIKVQSSQIIEVTPPFDVSEELPLLFLRDDTVALRIDSAFLVNAPRMRFYNRLHGFILNENGVNTQLLQIYEEMSREDEKIILHLNNQFNAMEEATSQHLRKSNLQLSALNQELTYIYQQNVQLQNQLTETKALLKQNRKGRFWKGIRNAVVWGGVGALVISVLK